MGRPPFDGPNAIELLGRVVRDDPVPPRRLAPGVPRDIERVCLTALEKSPGRRYQSGAALAEDCRRVQAGEPIAARAPGLGYRIRRTLWRHRGRAAVAALAALAAGAAVFVLAMRPRWAAQAADRAALAEALAARTAAEAAFREALAAGRLDDAVDGGRRLLAERSTLPTPPDIDLASALLARGRTRLARGDAQGTVDLADAFRVGRGSDAARDALLALADHLLEGGAASRAARVARLAAAHFGLDAPGVRVRLARSLERTAAVDEGLGHWQHLAADPAHAAEAAVALGAALPLLPHATAAPRTGLVVAGDTDGDGRAEVYQVDHEWRLRRLAWGPQGWREAEVLATWDPPAAATYPEAILLADADGDGAPELLVAGGNGDARTGRLVVVALAGARPVRTAAWPLTAGCRSLAVGDLDGDGSPEVLAGLQWYDRAVACFGYDGTQVTERFRWPMGCDVLGVRLLPGPRLAVWLGPWMQALPRPLCWRLGTTGATEADAAPIPWAFRWHDLRPGADGAWASHGGTPAWFSDGRAGWVDDRTCLVAASVLAEHRLVAPALRTGLFRLAVEPDGFAAPEPLGPAWPDGPPEGGVAVLRAGARPLAAVGRNDHLRVVPLGGGWRDLQIGGAPALAAGDLDGDGTDELVGTGGLDRSHCWGLGTFVAPPASAAAAAVVEGAVAPERELLEAGLFAEAAALCAQRLAEHPTPALHYLLGQARAGAGDWDAAATAFAAAAADRNLAADALLRRTHALTERRAWADLAACCDALIDTPGADAFGTAAAAAIGRWARAAAERAERWRWRAGEPLPGFLCEHPGKVRLSPDGWRALTTGDTGGDGSGVPLFLDGGPVRVRLRFRAPAPAWATGVVLGLQAVARFESGADTITQATLHMVWHAWGSSDRPSRRLVLRANTADGRGIEAALPAEMGDADPVERLLTLEYVPGLERVWLEIGPPDGPPDHVLGATLPAGLPRGLYTVGRTVLKVDGSGSGVESTPCDLLAITVEGGPGTGLATFEPSSPRGRLAVAGGLLAMGRVAEAARAYAEADADAVRRPDGWSAVRARVFAALCAVRQGDAAAAGRALAAARAVDPAAAEALLAVHCATECPEDEARALRAAWGR